MKALLIPVGSAGDVHPYLALGAALKARGHDVAIVANPYFASLVEKTGLDQRPWGTVDHYDTLTRHPDLWHERKGTQIIAAALRLGMPELYQIVRTEMERGPFIMVAHGLAFAARTAQEAFGLPLVTIHLQPSAILSVHDAPILHPLLASINRLPVLLKRVLFWAINRQADRVFGPAINQLRAEEGLAPAREIVRKWWHSPQRVIGFFPEWYAPPQPDWPAQTALTGFPVFDADTSEASLPELESFLASGSPPVVFVTGSANRQAERFFQAAVDACQRLGRRGVFLTRYEQHLPRFLPDEIRRFDYVPLSRILNRAAALVHHGGIGTAAQGLAAGIPQLVMPMSFDQPDNASRLGRLGVAKTVWPRAFKGPAVAEALDALLQSDTVRARCRELAERMKREDPVRRTCELIEKEAEGV